MGDLVRVSFVPVHKQWLILNHDLYVVAFLEVLNVGNLGLWKWDDYLSLVLQHEPTLGGQVEVNVVDSVDTEVSVIGDHREGLHFSEDVTLVLVAVVELVKEVKGGLFTKHSGGEVDQQVGFLVEYVQCSFISSPNFNSCSLYLKLFNFYF